MPTVSVIVPCYNQGRYVREAIDSVLAQTWQDFEIIVVDDSSTHPATQRVLRELAAPRTRVLHIDHKGLPGARNAGIREAVGRYILPLDADDKIGPQYLERAVAVLDGCFEVGIVYCDAEFFGAKTGRWDLPPYSFPEFLFSPRIFCTAMFRRSDWEQAGGYDEGLIYGWEDHDLWLSIIERGKEPYRIPEVLFFYRQAGVSLAGRMDKQRAVYSFRRMFMRHQKLFVDNIEMLLDAILSGEHLLDVAKPSFTARLYLPVGSSYSERDAEKVAYRPDSWTRLSWDVPVDTVDGSLALRFDPAENIGVFGIAALTLKSSVDGRIIWRVKTPREFDAVKVGGTALRLPHDHVLALFSYGTDPQVYLPLVNTAGPLRFEAWVRAEHDLGYLQKGIDAGTQRAAMEGRISELEAELAEARARIAALERRPLDRLLRGIQRS